MLAGKRWDTVEELAGMIAISAIDRLGLASAGDVHGERGNQGHHNNQQIHLGLCAVPTMDTARGSVISPLTYRDMLPSARMSATTSAQGSAGSQSMSTNPLPPGSLRSGGDDPRASCRDCG
jgi:hypothetical protein